MRVPTEPIPAPPKLRCSFPFSRLPTGRETSSSNQNSNSERPDSKDYQLSKHPTKTRGVAEKDNRLIRPVLQKGKKIPPEKIKEVIERVLKGGLSRVSSQPSLNQLAGSSRGFEAFRAKRNVNSSKSFVPPLALSTVLVRSKDKASSRALQNAHKKYLELLERNRLTSLKNLYIEKSRSAVRRFKLEKPPANSEQLEADFFDWVISFTGEKPSF